MSGAVDIAVLGAGPAGAHAALAAANAGAAVTLIDDQPAPGGQVWRAKSAAILSAPATPESLAGDALRAAVAASAVERMPSTRVWSIERHDGLWTLHLLADGAVTTLRARKLILAAGAREFVQPFPGWTTPGVVGLAGATATMKRDQVAPGRRVVVCGTGPLVFFVASEVRRLGGEVAAVVTANSRSDWLAALPAMARQPRLAVRGARWLADLALAGVPVLWRHTVTAATGRDRVDGVVVRRVDSDHRAVGTARHFSADTCAIGHGLLPNVEPGRLAGIGVQRDAVAGSWCLEAGADGSTMVDGLFVCGDGAAVRGALAAPLSGEIAGRAAAAASGHGDGPSDALIRRHRRAARFGAAMASLSRPRPGLAALATAETIVCRCEGVTRGAIEDEIASGAGTCGAVKSGTRAGMGPCGGRVCGTAIMSIIAAARDVPVETVRPPSVRPPLTPVPVSALASGFRYEDLPIRQPAPL